MKLLFVSGVSVGGAPRSTLELAERLALLHQVTVLLGAPLEGRNEYLYRRGVNLWVKLSNRGLGGPVHVLLRRAACHSTRSEPVGGVDVRVGGVAENAYLPLVDELRPDVVIVNSVPRAAWRWMSDDLRARGIKRVLYVREEHALTHLTISGEVPDLLVANSAAHAQRLEAAGFECVVVPSAIDRSAATVESTRKCLLLVNPIREHHVELALELADARPDVPVVLQESWPLDSRWRSELVAATRARPNVELRAEVPTPAEVYRDARVLLVPYPTNRPRVVAEAQHNGIPVLGADQPALAEAVGEGGAVVGLDAPVEQWLAALTEMWDDEAAYARLSALARVHDRRPELDPDHIAGQFEHALERLVA